MLLRAASISACLVVSMLGCMIIWGIGSNLARLDQIGMPWPVALIGSLIGFTLVCFGFGVIREEFRG